jgi:hypothetical protein
MRSRSTLSLYLTWPVLAGFLLAQGLSTKATKNDWEEINFEFNSSALVDGYPSLLRLAEILNQNPGHHVKLSGHADGIGQDVPNETLSKARAEAVRDFLVKNGARPGQIETVARGKSEPVASNATAEGRFMNRRVQISLTDDKGKEVGAAPLGLRLRPISESDRDEPPATNVPRPSISDRRGANDCFTVQVGAFQKWPNVERQRARFERESWLVQLQRLDRTPPLWRVLVGCESTRGAAEDLSARLEPQVQDNFVVRLPRQASAALGSLPSGL